jgi:hypothetical protein
MKIEFTVISATKNGYGRMGWKKASTELKVWLDHELGRVNCLEHGENCCRGVIAGSYEAPKIEIRGCCRPAINEAIKVLS